MYLTAISSMPTLHFESQSLHRNPLISFPDNCGIFILAFFMVILAIIAPSLLFYCGNCASKVRSKLMQKGGAAIAPLRVLSLNSIRGISKSVERIFQPIKDSSNFPVKDHFRWETNKDNCEVISSFNMVSFNLLAPCYKRLHGTKDGFTGKRLRESGNYSLWMERAGRTLQFFRSNLLGATADEGEERQDGAKASIIALQEFWLHHEYTAIFDKEFFSLGYELHYLQRSGKKTDAVALVINAKDFEVLGREDIHLCSMGDRVALLLYLLHKDTGKHVLVANTHLSFPHHALDRLNQMQQMKKLISSIDAFAERHSIKTVTRIVMGDFNVESNSPVCEHLRESGYFSCFEVSPPGNMNHRGNSSSGTSLLTNNSSSSITESHAVSTSVVQSEEDIVSMYGRGLTHSPAARFVSHRTHNHEDLGVDHIFIKPETASASPIASLLRDTELDTQDESAGTRGGDELFVHESVVYPGNACASNWCDEFYCISDHRPVGSKIIFGKRIR